MGSLIIIVALFALLWVLIIRPQRAKQQKQQRMLNEVDPGDEILTVGGIYGIVQEIEEEDEGGDLVVEIAEGIHVRVARRAVAAVVKPDDEDDEDDDVEGEDASEDANEDGDDVDDVVDGDAELVEEPQFAPPGEAEVKDEGESVNPHAAGEAAASDRS
jgi:preprotein translocase subunit YajC